MKTLLGWLKPCQLSWLWEIPHFKGYKNIIAKREGYGPIGNGGNGLILHTTLAIEPLQGQSLGLLWQKLVSREPKAKPPANETPLRFMRSMLLKSTHQREKKQFPGCC